jgi:ribosome maturation factor RimP
MEIKTKIEGWLVPFLEERNLFLVELKVQGKKKIEVFADSDTGISINECAEISKFLGGLLDEADIMSDNYTLDVSSPGHEQSVAGSSSVQKTNRTNTRNFENRRQRSSGRFRRSAR